ncbi:MAG: TlpA family protein disulfide reductase [Magnetococcus sp. DMHC-6]
MKRIVWIVLFFLCTIASAHAEEPWGLDMPLNTLSGQPIRLADFKGKVVLINFWATWCQPCLGEIPDLIAFQKEYEERGVVVVGVNYMDTSEREELLAFQKKHNISYPMVFGDPGRIGSLGEFLGGVRGLPTSKLLNREGKPVQSIMGAIKLENLKKIVDPLL